MLKQQDKQDEMGGGGEKDRNSQKNIRNSKRNVIKNKRNRRKQQERDAEVAGETGGHIRRYGHK
jgi:hypothetical protein